MTRKASRSQPLLGGFSATRGSESARVGSGRIDISLVGFAARAGIMSKNEDRTAKRKWTPANWSAWGLWLLLMAFSPLFSFWLAQSISLVCAIIPSWALVLPAVVIFSSRTEFMARSWVCLLSIAIAVIVSVCTYTFLFSVGGVIDSHPSETGEARLSHEIGTCFYLSVMTFTTVGYGDVVPHRNSRILAISEAFLGYFLLGVFLSYVIQTIGRLTDGRQECEATSN